MGTLYFGDNLHILREHIAVASVDLIYLDPPFNSKRDYNVYLSSPKGQRSDAQITAFEDTWHWGDRAEKEYSDLLHQANTDMAELLTALRRFLHESDIMAYLVMMSNRLLAMHQVLKPTGSIYLHCDPTASHYLKVILDTIFGADKFRNEIIWKRTSAHNDPKRYGNNYDTIFYYSKSKDPCWNQLFAPYSDDYVASHYGQKDEKGYFTTRDLSAPDHGTLSKGLRYLWKGKNPPAGRTWSCVNEKMIEFEKQDLLTYSKDGMPRLKRYLTNMPGVSLQSIWTDIPPINSQAAERLGYPTQKPLELLERIILASSNPGDIVLDPFCGCGTAIHAAQKLGREWIGIDITHLAIHLVERRMKDAFSGIQFKIHGEPEDLDAARDLAERDKYEFQFWACSMVGAQPYRGGKKGADSGTDGIIYFQDEKNASKKIIVSVKGGEHVTRTMIADLKNTVDREGAQIGLFVSLIDPTEPMRKEALSAGFYINPYEEQFPKIQIMTITDLLAGKKPQYRDFTMGAGSFKQAKAEKGKGDQPTLFNQ